MDDKKRWRCIEDDDYAGGGYWECPSCKNRFSFQGFNMLNHMPYCPKCGSRVKTALEGGKTMTNEEAQARWICCPMCDRDTCNRNADDCDVKKWIEKKEA